MSHPSHKADAPSAAETKKAAEAEKAAETKHKAAAHSHSPIPFVRAGGQLVNLAHVISVGLPVEGDPKRPLSLHLANGTNLNLTGDDAAAVLDALGCHCDVGTTQA
jgi:hypothetical protein